MPTGYTADVEDGKLTDFRTFALRCARAFGACVMQRDDNFHDPPQHREPTDHHVKAIEAAKTRIAELEAMTPAAIESAAFDAHFKTLAEWEGAVKRTKEQNARHEAMIVKVKAWMPPSAEHVALKTFMLEQLETSKHEMSGSWWKKPEAEMPGEWHQVRLKNAREDVEYHEKKNAEELARCKVANEWIDALYASLAVP